MTLKEFFEKNAEVAVAFSGGVDSAVLLCLAKKYAKKVCAYYVKTQFQPAFELEDALEISSLLNAEMKVIELDILSDKTVVSNPENRCYYCKKKIFSSICKKAEEDGFNAVLDGTNASDDLNDRPGVKALNEYGVLSPLMLCGKTKKDVRGIARENGLPVADKPSYACLATRVAFGTPIKDEYLKKTEKAEDMLRERGFRNFRVRYLDGSALLQFGKTDYALFEGCKDEVYGELLKDYKNVYLDLKERTDE